MDRCLGSLAHPKFVTSSSVMGDVTTALLEIRAIDVSATHFFELRVYLKLKWF